MNSSKVIILVEILCILKVKALRGAIWRKNGQRYENISSKIENDLGKGNRYGICVF